MFTIDHERVSALAKHAAPNSVTLWMPTHRGGRDIREDPIRLKDLLAKAQQQLIDLGVRPAEADQRIGLIRRSVANGHFWRTNLDGLGIFLGDGNPQFLRVPFYTPEIASVCNHFYIKPLLGAPQQNNRFYILAISENTVRLFSAGRYEFEAMDLAPGPRNFHEYQVAADIEPQHIEFHSGAAAHATAANRPTMFHGQGARGDFDKVRLAEYCRLVDEEVTTTLRGREAPLLLAAAEPLGTIYRQNTHYTPLSDRIIAGNPDAADPAALHRQAVEVMTDEFLRPIRSAQSRYHRAMAGGLASNDIEGILRAACANAIDVLLVTSQRQLWGRFDHEQGTLEQRDDQQCGDEDLLNLAAVLARRGGADVYAVEQRHMPGDSLAAAILRFRLGQ
ncbi:MAG: hypothetical protein ACOC95_06070 [Planctomycetota bacterium]